MNIVCYEFLIMMIIKIIIISMVNYHINLSIGNKNELLNLRLTLCFFVYIGFFCKYYKNSVILIRYYIMMI